jgi:hypothetical protein
MLPGRAAADARELAEPFSGMVMNQWSARARGSLFAVGYVDLTRLEPGMQDALARALVRNISGTVESERTLSLGDAQGRETVARGQASGHPVVLRLRVYQRSTRLYQLACIGSPGDLTEEELEMFFGSFHFRTAP